MTEKTNDTNTTPADTVQICPKQTAQFNARLTNIEQYIKALSEHIVRGDLYADYESITVTASAPATLTVNKRTTYKMAYLTCENNPIRYRLDGIAPTATEGHTLAAGADLKLKNKDVMAQFKAIATGADAILKVSYGAPRAQNYAVADMED